MKRPVIGTIRPPGSKSITNRALVLGALASHTRPVDLAGVLFSEDTELMIEALRQLGFEVQAEPSTGRVYLQRTPGTRLIPASRAELFCGNSGTTLRFLTALVSLGQGSYRLDGVPRMRERPIEDLLAALRQLGVEAVSETGTGCPPVRITTSGWPRKAQALIRGEVSSQFLSALLLAAPWSGSEVTLQLPGALVSQPYVDMTLAMLERFGARVVVREDSGAFAGSRTFWIPAQQPCGCKQYVIEPDATAATYWWAVAAITGGSVSVSGLGQESLQGDVRFVEVLQRMGCRVDWTAQGITVSGGPVRGVDVDMNAISDTVMTLAAVACFAEGPTRIFNVAHIRHKETDRLAALACELRRLGITVRESPDGLEIHPGPMHGALVETYNDHRLAMSLALIGLRVPNVIIQNPACVAKTYPEFFADLERLCVSARSG
ncbi:3-phosphoshikimate 1-carboxyvinyltransferase [bacterium HR36]|nr:3-phosphoshikimate 1-carboxyvinyltransferase [bacterium HR36]